MIIGGLARDRDRFPVLRCGEPVAIMAVGGLAGSYRIGRERATKASLFADASYSQNQVP
jgi:hypothetical protein